MRVTFVLRCLTMMHGGGETRHLAWARELRAAGDEVTMITGRPLLARPRCPVDPATVVLRSPYTRDLVYRMQGKRGFGRFGSRLLHTDEEWFCRAAWRAIVARPEQPDLVHFHALSQAARLRRNDIPTVVNLPGAPHDRYIADLRLADAIVADGWAAEHLPAIVGREVDHVPKGVDTDRFRPEGRDERAALGLEGKTVVLVVSRLVPIKNVALAIDAMMLASRELPELTMLIVGDGPQQGALAAKVAASGLTGRVRFAGRVPHEELPAWYRSAHLFVLPSEFDNSPNVVLEAMSSGLPLVATDVGGLRQYVQPSVNGDLVPLNAPGQLAAAIVRFASDSALARRIGRRNREDAVSRHSWAQSALRLRGVYQRVISRKADQPHAGYRASA
jgi:glycosyltransferase involved in cell wall biosynthesis